ncbi:MAG: amidohydrolase, partial [Gammaproteobacteria bacterium]|nr:amidohydrolase [Gammaproteobacteria bacterium]
MQRIIGLIAALVAAPALMAQPTAVVNVNVVPMVTETVIRQQTVIVDNGVITALGPVDDIAIPEDTTVIDGTDRFLMPGLAEMHAHVPGAGSDELDRYFSLYVANGVTTVRGMLGQKSHLELRERLLDDKVFGPRLVTSGPSFNGRSVSGVNQARQMVREQHRVGYDFIK